MYVDTHCHLDLHGELAPDDQVAQARDAGVELLVTVATGLDSSKEQVELAHRLDGVYATVGIHPNYADEADPESLSGLELLLDDPLVVGVGETGLDYYREGVTPQQQAAAFRAQIAIAKRHDKALVVHCRDTARGGEPGQAWRDTLDVLAEDAPDRVILHCFSGDATVARECAGRGYFLSFAGNVTFKNADALRHAALATPAGQLLTETDAPFLTPAPHRGSPNEPGYVAHTLRFLAETRGEDVDELAATVRDNALRAFALA